MPAEPDERIRSALIGLDQTTTQIGKIVALGREAVEGDEFLPLAAQQLGVFSVDVPALRAALADDLASARSARATVNDAEADKQ